MAKNGTKVDELYLGIGLDLDELQLDFDTAGKTVSQCISRLNSENKQIKIKTDIELSKLEGAGTDLDKLKTKFVGVNQQIDIQKQKLELLKAAYAGATQKYGADNGITQRAETSYLAQQRVVAGMNAEMRKLSTQIQAAGGHAENFGGKMAAGFERAKAGMNGLSSGYTILNAKLAGVMALFSTGAGLFNITKDSMEAGENLYKLQTRLHTTTEEAYQLSTVFKIAGTDINSIIPLFARLDRQVLAGGEDGNKLTEAMQQFGISLTDQAGGLLPINQQLEQLAAGYRKAADAGKEETFTASVLGPRGAALVPLLAEYNDAMKVASMVHTTGLLNVKEAHELDMQWKAMTIDAGNLENAFGAAMMPVAEDLMPDIISGFQTMIQAVKDNKDAIKNFGETIIEVMHTAKDVIGDVADALNKIGVNSENLKKAAMYTRYLNSGSASAVEQAAGVAGGLPWASLMGHGGVSAGFDEWAEQQKKFDALNKLNQDDAKKFAGATSWKAAPAAPVDKPLTPEQIKQLDKIKEEINDFGNAFETDIDRQLDAVDKKAAKLKEEYTKANGGKEDDEANAVIEESALAQKAKIREQFETDVMSKINAIGKTELQNKLDDIEREKKAFIQKGVDEVAAEKWAADQRKKATGDAVRDALTSQKEQLKIFKDAMQGRSADGRIMLPNMSTEDRMKLAQQELMQYQLKKDGVKMDDLMWLRSGNNLGMFQQAMQGANPYSMTLGEMGQQASWMAPMMAADGRMQFYNQDAYQQYADATNRMGGGNVGAAGAGNVTVNVSIDTAVTEDSESMSALADQVADRITPAVQQALGDDDNSY